MFIAFVLELFYFLYLATELPLRHIFIQKLEEIVNR